MSSIVLARAGRYLDDARSALARAPVEVAIAVFLAVTWSYAIETRTFEPAWFETAFVAVLVWLAAWGATMLHALGVWTAGVRRSVTLAAAIVAAVHGAVLTDLQLAGDAWQAAMLVAAFACLVFAAPAAVGRGEERTDSMRGVNGRIALRTIGIAIYAAALYAGLVLALVAVNTLFELELGGAIYAHVFGWIFLALVPWVIVGGLPDYVRDHRGDDRVAAVVHRMSAFLVPPLLAVYLAILVAYIIRIILTGEVPKNLVSPMVTAAGALAIVALLLFDPRPEQRSALRWLRGVPFLLVPLAGLGIATIGMRVAQYGWTEFRALRAGVLAVMMALAACAAYDVLRRRRFALHTVPLATAVLFGAAAVGPWSALSIAERSQQNRLVRLLDDAGVDIGVRMPTGAAAREVEAPVYDGIRATSQYLRTHFGVDALPPEFAAAAARDGGYTDFAALAGLRRAPPRDASPAFASARLPEGIRVLNGFGGSYYRVRLGPEHRRPDRLAAAANAADAFIVQDGARLRVRVADAVYTADLASIAAVLAEPPQGDAALSPDDALLIITDSSGATRGALLILDVHARWEAGRLVLDLIDGVLVIAPH